MHMVRNLTIIIDRNNIDNTDYFFLSVSLEQFIKVKYVRLLYVS